MEDMKRSKKERMAKHVLVAVASLATLATLATVAWGAAGCKKSKSKKRGLVGVIGGLGPKATALWYDENVLKARVVLFKAMQDAAPFYSKMLQSVHKVSTANWTEEQVAHVWTNRLGKNKVRDQDHISLLIYTNPTIPGRPEFMSGASQVDPTKDMAATAQALVDGGASALCMVCSTAHYFKNGMLEDINVPFLDMIELTLDHIARSVPPTAIGGEKKIIVGLLGTEPLLRFRVYEDACEKRFPLGSGVSVEMLTPLSLEKGEQENFNRAIFGQHGIKAGYDSDLACAKTRANFDLLLCEVEKLVNAGAQAIILGCTELPLLLSDETLAAYSDLGPLLLVNPAQVLADQVILYSLTQRDHVVI